MFIQKVCISYTSLGNIQQGVKTDFYNLVCIWKLNQHQHFYWNETLFYVFPGFSFEN